MDRQDRSRACSQHAHKPSVKWTKDRGKEPHCPKAEYPRLWGWDEKTGDVAVGKAFDGNRRNACHYTKNAKQAASEAARSVATRSSERT